MFTLGELCRFIAPNWRILKRQSLYQLKYVMFIGRELLCFTVSNWRILKRYNIFAHLCFKPTCDTMASSALSRALHILTASIVYNTLTRPLLSLSLPLLALSCPLLALSLLWPPLYTLTASIWRSKGLYYKHSPAYTSISRPLLAHLRPLHYKHSLGLYKHSPHGKYESIRLLQSLSHVFSTFSRVL